MKISDEYRILNEALHGANPAYGTSGAKAAKDVMWAYGAVGALNILDYGAGKGLLKSALPEEMDVREYDPAIPEMSAPPQPADLVACTDVLEHIEPEYLAEVLEDINRLSLKGAYLSISCRQAKKFLADGRNAHLIVEKPMWWISKLSACFGGAVAGGFRFDQNNLIAWVQK